MTFFVKKSYLCTGIKFIKTMISKRIQGKKRNKLLRYKAVQDEFNKHDCLRIPITVIWRDFIYPKFFISRDTLYRILSTPVEEELRAVEQEIQKLNTQQPSLF